MANLKSVIKRIKTSRRNRSRRLKVENVVKKAMKDAVRAIVSKKDQAAELVRSAIKLIDKAVSNGIFKKNTASRKKSRLMKRFNVLKNA